ncbi:MAG: hypothetical protein EOM91_03730 [Sphingobacteriia bacterium]|nr:hypothetical protein [Sphingobacteriia bacterium]NCC39746.1 hypothetical protein [Gammaproteobacteria bacterium]
MASHRHRGTRAIQRLVEYAPATGGLALWIRHQDLAPDAPLPLRQGPQGLLAANDGTRILYGPAFETLPLPLQTGLVAHQVLHVALRHPQRRAALQRLRGTLDDELFNLCADAIVNSTLSHLSWLELPPGAIQLEQLLESVLDIHQGVETALLEWDLEGLYRAIDDRRPAEQTDGAGRRPGTGGADGERPTARTNPNGPPQPSASPPARIHTDGPRAARARHLAADNPPDLLPAPDDAHPEQDAEQAREWRERITRAHAGDGPHSMLRALLADRPRVRTPWEQILRTRLARALSHQPDRSWSRPSRSYLANQGRRNCPRMPWEPGTTASRAVARLVVMVDVSGSIEAPLLDRFATEIESISRRLEAALVIIIGDTQVNSVTHFTPGRSNLRAIRVQGGGGTDFTPLLREAERHAPDIGVILTDLDGPAHYAPNYPLIWAVPAAHAERPHPFGRKLVLE